MLRKLMLVTAFLGLAGLSVTNYVHAGTNGLTDPDRNGDASLLWVLNSDAVAHTTGTVVIYHTAGTYPGLSVSTTITANSGLGAGVVVQNSLPASGWGWIKTSGYVEMKVQSGVTAGDTVVTSTTAEKGGVYTVANATGTAAGEAISNSKIGTVIETATDGTAKVILTR